MSDDAGQKRTFTVRLVRPAFRYIDVQVRSTSSSAAVAAAAKRAVKVPLTEWGETDLDEDSAALDILRVIDHRETRDEVKERKRGGLGGETVAEVVMDELENALFSCRYLLLAADLDEAEGRLVRSQWLAELGENLELADIASDWLVGIKRLRDLGARGFWHEMDGISRAAGKVPPDRGDPRWGVFPGDPGEDD